MKRVYKDDLCNHAYFNGFIAGKRVIIDELIIEIENDPDISSSNIIALLKEKKKDIKDYVELED